jgi:hypothetical protein
VDVSVVRGGIEFASLEALWLSCFEKKAPPMSLVGFPLLLIPLAICNIIAFLMPGLSFSAPLFTVPLMSGVGWAVTLSDLLLALGILMLLFEVIKGARPGAKYLTDHLLSLIVFGAAAAEFLLLPQFGTSTYFLLTALALVDFLSGIALRTRRPHVASVATSSARSSATSSAKVVEPPSEAPAEPRFEPAPAPSIPLAEPIVEPIVEPAPPEPVEPNVVHSEVVAQELPRESPPESSPDAPLEPHEPSPEIQSPEIQSPEIQSPGIQPGSGAHPPPDTPPR